MITISLLLVYLFMFAFFYLYLYYKPFLRLPGPPIWASLTLVKYRGLSFPAALHKFFVQLETKYQPHGLFVFFNAFFPNVFVHDKDLVEMILKDSTRFVKGKEYSFLTPWLGNSVILSNGPEWKKRRTLLNPAFHASVLQTFLSVINAHAKELVKKIRGSESVEIYSLMNRYTLGIICETAMGYRLTQSDADTRYINATRETCRLVMERSFSPLDHSDFIYYRTKAGKAFKSHLETIHNFCGKIIEERKKEPKDFEDNSKDVKKRRMALLDLLLSYQKENKEITDEILNQEVNTISFAGHDTSSSALTMILHTLGIHTDHQMKLKEEIRSILGSDTEREITNEDLSQMSYLDCIIKEGLRLYPPVGHIPREATTDFTLSGHKLPKGTVIFVNIEACHRNPTLFPEPDLFKPERFLGESGTSTTQPGYLPFILGPRNCMGQRFALMEIKLTIAELMRHFTVKTLTKEVNLGIYLVLKPSADVMIQFTLDH